MQLESVPRCPVCGQDNRRPLHQRLTDKIFRTAPGTWDLYQCAHCKSAYLDPRPTEDTIYEAYGTYYTHEAPVQGRRPQTLGQKYQGLPQPVSGSRLLDVGCGSGNFLLQAQSLGWSVFGCDPDEAAVRTAREAGLDVRSGGIEAFYDMPEQFDVITMSHVIEHVYQPKHVLKDALRLLKPGGVLWIDTPNINSFGHAHYGPDWRGLEPPRHLMIFNWRSLEEILHESGFNNLVRIPRLDLYGKLAASSRAIQEGRDPYASHNPSLIDRLFARLIVILTRFFPERTEYLTLIAKKS